MTRAGLRVRPATTDDLPVLVEFAREMRENRGPEMPRPRAGGEDDGLEQRYLAVLADPAKHLVLCVRAGDEPMGMGLLTVGPANPLLDLTAVHLSHAVVPGRYRRRGAGKALVAAAVEYAESLGIEQLVVAVDPASRESNRFYARLGLAPLAVRRTAPVALVRRRLAEVRQPVLEQPAHTRRPGRRSGRAVRGSALSGNRGLPLGRVDSQR